MKVEVKLSSTLRKGRFSRQTIDLPDGSTVANLLEQLELTTKEVAVVAVNMQYAAQDRPLEAGDEIAIYPPAAGG
jgi:molybdopterin converting factor small subunit